jgi:hypothetical protein
MRLRAGWWFFLALTLAAASAAEDKKPAKKTTEKPQAASTKDSPEEGGTDKPAEPAAVFPDPQFRSQKGTDSFKKAKESFDLEKYVEARDEMKRSRDQTKGPEDRALLDKWIAACDSGVALEGYKRAAERGTLRKTFFAAMDSAERCRQTPIGPRYAAFLEELRPKVLEVLENFDTPSQKYSEKYGKRFVGDAALVFHGSHCLEWSSTKGGKASQLRINAPNVPAKWTPYQSVVFWMRCQRPVDVQILVASPGKETKESNVMEASYAPPAKSGWVRAEVDLEKFQKHGSASFSNVEALILQIGSRTSFKFLIDEIALVKKDGKEQSAAADAKDDPGSKKSKKPQK